MPLTRPIQCLLCLVLWSGTLLADELRLRADHPDHYVVQKGDTLWDISARFLRDPWRWPEIWRINSEIRNPHLIYPGDVIDLVFRNGRPELRLRRPGRPLVKLSPTGRISPLPNPITTLPAETIRQFLQRPRLLDREALDRAAYIVANDGGHLISGSDNRVYARGIGATRTERFVVIHEGRTYTARDDEDEILGIEALTVADARLVGRGDPATLYLTRTSREVLIGDRLLPADDEEDLPYFTPHAPATPIDGSILDVLDGVSRIGQYHTVIIDKGRRDGVDPGLVLAVYQRGETIPDPRDEETGETRLPDERAGTVMVVRAFDRLSYALVMRATRSMRLGDRITAP